MSLVWKIIMLIRWFSCTLSFPIKCCISSWVTNFSEEHLIWFMVPAASWEDWTGFEDMLLSLLSQIYCMRSLQTKIAVWFFLWFRNCKWLLHHLHLHPPNSYYHIKSDNKGWRWKSTVIFVYHIKQFWFFLVAWGFSCLFFIAFWAIIEGL